MSLRIDKSWTVMASLESEDGTRCVDIFRRPDGTFGWEEFRRDPEDQGRWTPVRYASALVYQSRAAAEAAARGGVAWSVAV